MNLSPELIASLLGDLYEAAAEPGRFQAFVERVVRLTDSSRGYFLFVDSRHECDLFLDSGFGPEATQTYLRDFLHRDVVLDSYVRAQNRAGGDWIGTRESVLDDQTFYSSEVYNELVRKMGDRYVAAAAMGAMPEGVQGGFAIRRSATASNYDSDTITLLALLAPHLKRALLLHRTLSDLDNRAALAEHSIEAFAIAAISLSRDGKVIRMSSQAADIIARNDGLSFADGSIHASSRDEDETLQALVRQATSVADPNASVSLSVPQDLQHAPEARPAARRTPGAGGSLLVTRRPPQPPLQVTVFPFHSSTALLLDKPSALVFVADSTSPPRPRGQLLRALYSLTPMEARLANCLLDGLDIRAAADLLRLSTDTARFYLKNIYRKTGVNSQSALMRLMLQLPGEH